MAANEHQVEQAVKQLCDTDVAMANALSRPCGEKAYTDVLHGLPTTMLRIVNEVGIL